MPKKGLSLKNVTSLSAPSTIPSKPATTRGSLSMSAKRAIPGERAAPRGLPGPLRRLGANFSALADIGVANCPSNWPSLIVAPVCVAIAGADGGEIRPSFRRRSSGPRMNGSRSASNTADPRDPSCLVDLPEVAIFGALDHRLDGLLGALHPSELVELHAERLASPERLARRHPVSGDLPWRSPWDEHAGRVGGPRRDELHEPQELRRWFVARSPSKALGHRSRPCPPAPPAGPSTASRSCSPRTLRGGAARMSSGFRLSISLRLQRSRSPGNRRHVRAGHLRQLRRRSRDSTSCRRSPRPSRRARRSGRLRTILVLFPHPRLDWRRRRRGRGCSGPSPRTWRSAPGGDGVFTSSAADSSRCASGRGRRTRQRRTRWPQWRALPPLAARRAARSCCRSHFSPRPMYLDAALCRRRSCSRSRSPEPPLGLP